MKLLTVLIGLVIAAQVVADENFKNLYCYGENIVINRQGEPDTTVTVRFSGTIREKDGEFRLTHYQGYIDAFAGGGFSGFSVTEGKSLEGREYTEGRRYQNYLVFPVKFGGEEVQLLHPNDFHAHTESDIVLKLSGFSGGFNGYAHVHCPNHY